MESVIYPILSCIFVLVTICIFVTLWRKHNLHGWTQFAFLISAFLYFLAVVIRKSYRDAHEGVSSPSIERIYTFFTLGHCTNVVNLSAHMFWTFLKIEPEASVKSFTDLRPLFHSLLLCWTFPAFITIIELFANEQTIANLETGVFVVLICLNLVIILGTVIVIRGLIRAGRHVQSTHNLQLRDLIVLFLRLFTITGLIWTVKIIPILTSPPRTRSPGAFWRVIYILSDSYGIPIFLVFVFNTRIWGGLTELPRIRKMHKFCCNCIRLRHNKRNDSMERKFLASPQSVSYRNFTPPPLVLVRYPQQIL